MKTKELNSYKGKSIEDHSVFENEGLLSPSFFELIELTLEFKFESLILLQVVTQGK